MRAARDVLESDSQKFRDIVEAIRVDHIQAGQDAISSDLIIEDFTKQVDAECFKLLKILESAQFLKAVTNQTNDMIISVGEKLSCLYMTALLRDRGANAVYIDLSDVVTFQLVAKGLDDAFYKNLAFAIAKRVLEHGDDAVPVITGYFGAVPGGLLENIGRGYTDLCAALAAVGLRAKELQIWKEVDGIFTADPRKVPTARLLDSVTPAEAAELTFYGSEVIHPFTMDQVIRASIPIRIKNVMNPRNAGTVIFPDAALKIYLTASAAQRAERRHKQLISKDISTTIDSLRADLEARDLRDSSRSVAPLKPAHDARLLDNSTLSVEDSVERVLDWWRQQQPFGIPS